jgi:hypothetical protein
VYSEKHSPKLERGYGRLRERTKAEPGAIDSGYLLSAALPENLQRPRTSGVPRRVEGLQILCRDVCHSQDGHYIP